MGAWLSVSLYDGGLHTHPASHRNRDDFGTHNTLAKPKFNLLERPK